MITKDKILELAKLSVEPLGIPWLEALENAHAPYYRFLYHVAKELNNNSMVTVVVLGINKAVCCAHICEALKTINNIVLGIDQVMTKEALDVANNCNNFLPICGLSIESKIEHTIADFEPIHMVFFDTTHTYQQVKGEFGIMKKYLVDGAVLVFDDVHAAEDSVLKAINEIPGEYIPLDFLHTDLGFGVKVWKND